MKSRLISDGQLSASSSFKTWGIDTFTWQPQFARLDKQGKTNAWSPAHNNRSEWIQVREPWLKWLKLLKCPLKAVDISKYDCFLLQVDLEKTKRLTGIITQGAKDFGVVQFVSVFKVAYSNNGESWSIVKDENTGKDEVTPKIDFTVCTLYVSGII